MASSEEMSGLPPVSAEVREAALAEWRCPYLGADGCRVYAERPLVCRLFGTTPRLPCPNGRRPASMIDARIDRQIGQFFENTRHVLL